MIELVFVACLMSAPDVCEEQAQAYLPDIGIHGCMMTAQQQLAQWTVTHPSRQVVRWSCGWADQRERDA